MPHRPIRTPGAIDATAAHRTVQFFNLTRETVMIYSKLIAAATIAALPFVAIASDADSPRVQVLSGERGFVFIDPPSKRTRAEVRAEIAAAIDAIRRAGGERGYVFVDAPSQRSRAEVLAELREAQRLCLLARGECGAPIATRAQEARIRRVGKAAATMQARLPGAERG